ncbi:MAG: hypothetical protein F6J99_41505, partial [Moorea sp. SIO4G3]|nr:hypothetical protein [Moorena sp. SIO4G3]
MQRGLGGSPHERLHQDKAGSALPTWQALLVFRSPTPHTPHPTPHTPHPTPHTPHPTPPTPPPTPHTTTPQTNVHTNKAQHH